MKQVKRWIAALLVGEFVTLRNKDKKFKKSITDADSRWDKIKLTFDGLFNFNKNLIQQAENIRFDSMKEKALNWFDRESSHLEDKIQAREKEFGTRSDEKLPIYLMGLDSQFQNYEKKVLAWKDKLIEEVDLEKNLELFRTRIEEARKYLDSIEKE